MLWWWTLLYLSYQEWKELAQKYRDLAAQEKNVIFIGRLAEYKYYDMDDVIRRGLDVFKENFQK